MKQTRITLILLALLALLAVVSCRSAKESAPATPISYTEARNYFVRNDVQHFGEMQITTQEQFDSTFGAAAYMGQGGQPTPIDFSRQMVLAVTCEPVNRQVSLVAVSLSASADGTLTLVYRKKVTPGSATRPRPALWWWPTRCHTRQCALSKPTDSNLMRNSDGGNGWKVNHPLPLLPSEKNALVVI